MAQLVNKQIVARLAKQQWPPRNESAARTMQDIVGDGCLHQWVKRRMNRCMVEECRMCGEVKGATL